MDSRRRRHAIVIGGGIAGLCAARALAGHFERVTVLERDTVPDETELRVGVLQGRHAHLLAARGRDELEGLFPGFEAGLRARGCVRLDLGEDIARLRRSGWAPPEPSGLVAFSASRVAIERTLRALVLEDPNVAFIERACVSGLVRDGQRVSGVRLRGAPAHLPAELAADLVVDASGRSSLAVQWLEDLGADTPADARVEACGHHATRWFEAPSPSALGREWWWRGMFVEPRPQTGLPGVTVLPVEDDRWIVTLSGLEDALAPQDEGAFGAALRRLPTRIVAAALAQAKPLSPIFSQRAQPSRLRAFERARGLPGGFVAIGDAVCALGPAQGQGIAVAAIGASLLASLLARSRAKLGAADPAFARAFFRAQARLLRGQFAFAASTSVFGGLCGGVAEGASAWLRAVDAAATKDRHVRRVLARVQHWQAEPSALRWPEVASRVAAHAVRCASQRALDGALHGASATGAAVGRVGRAGRAALAGLRFGA